MATMLCAITTDAALPQPTLRKALKDSVEVSFNRITVDGDMSTNDPCFSLPRRIRSDAAPSGFPGGSIKSLRRLHRMIVKDGEGVSKFVEIELHGAASAKDAGARPKPWPIPPSPNAPGRRRSNWGRIMDALVIPARR